jgi:hypothetical protein
MNGCDNLRLSSSEFSAGWSFRLLSTTIGNRRLRFNFSPEYALSHLFALGRHAPFGFGILVQVACAACHRFDPDCILAYISYCAKAWKLDTGNLNTWRNFSYSPYGTPFGAIKLLSMQTEANQSPPIRLLQQGGSPRQVSKFLRTRRGRFPLQHYHDYRGCSVNFWVPVSVWESSL